MKIKELGSCDHVRRGDRIVEFELKAHPPLEDKKNRQTYHAICPKCDAYMKWENWTKLHEPLRAKCISCGLLVPSNELNLLPAEGTQASKPDNGGK